MLFNTLVKNTVKHIALTFYWKHKYQNCGDHWVGLIIGNFFLLVVFYIL